MSDLTHKPGRPVFLAREDRQLLVGQAGRLERFEARRDLVKDSDNSHGVNLILEGWACSYKELEDGRRQIISIFLPGDFCEPTLFLFPKISPALGSITPVTLARWSRDEMKALMTANPTLERSLWLDTAICAEIQREWTVSLGRRTAAERMAHLFCELSLRLDAVGLYDGKQCEMPLTQADLADTLGLSAVHINRTLQELRNLGFVELKGKRLTIYDQKSLRDLAMFDESYLHLPQPAHP